MLSNSIEILLFLFIKIMFSLFMNRGMVSIYNSVAQPGSVPGFYDALTKAGFWYLIILISIHFRQEVDEQKLFFKPGNLNPLPQRNHCIGSCQEY